MWTFYGAISYVCDILHTEYIPKTWKQPFCNEKPVIGDSEPKNAANQLEYCKFLHHTESLSAIN